MLAELSVAAAVPITVDVNPHVAVRTALAPLCAMGKADLIDWFVLWEFVLR